MGFGEKCDINGREKTTVAATGSVYLLMYLVGLLRYELIVRGKKKSVPLSSDTGFLDWPSLPKVANNLPMNTMNFSSSYNPPDDQYRFDVCQTQ